MLIDIIDIYEASGRSFTAGIESLAGTVSDVIVGRASDSLPVKISLGFLRSENDCPLVS